MHRMVLHNGEIGEAGAKVLAPGQVGLLTGWGVFSTLRVVRGIPFAFERHWERMRRDAAALGVPFPEDRAAVRAALGRLIDANHAFDGALRVMVIRNRGGAWEGPSSQSYDLIAFTAPVKDWGSAAKLAIQEQGRHAASPWCGVKSLSAAPNLALLEQAQRRGFNEVLLLNERGEVCECTSANLFIARNGEVLTPPLDSGCLPGVTREILLEEIRVPGIAIREETLTLAELERAEAVFITSTTRNLLPVEAIEGHEVRQDPRLYRQLEDAFERYIEEYLASQR